MVRHLFPLGLLGPSCVHGGASPPSAMDDAIVGALAASFEDERGVRAMDVHAIVRDGVVRLTGEVPDLLSAERAVVVAVGVPRVRAVIDELRVRPPARPDSVIRADLVTAWALDPVVETWQVGLDVLDGAVTITGQVDSEAERAQATRLAKGIPGVRGVEDRVVVLRPDVRSDGEVLADVLSRLAWEVGAAADAVTPSVANGVVTLRGTVPSDRARAEVIAGVVAEAALGHEALSVQAGAAPSPPTPDDALRRALEDALRADPRVLSAHVSVSVARGVVRLTGAVPTELARQSAEADARQVVGVVDVRNELTLR